MKDVSQDKTGFFIERDECLNFGCCVDIAPKLFTYDQSDCSMISAQPETEGDLDQLYSAIACCPIDCIKYGGDDPEKMGVLRQARSSSHGERGDDLRHTRERNSRWFNRFRGLFRRKK